jgi:hypothetical protein
MKATADNPKDRKNKSAVTPDRSGEQSSSFVDNRSHSVTQRKLQEAANNSPNSLQSKAVHQMVNKGRSLQQLSPPNQSAIVQRRAYIGNDYAVPDNAGLSDEAKALKADDTVRRFDSKAELQNFAAGSAKGMGLVNGNWVHLPEKMLVLGEDHGDRKAPDIINGTGVTKFRYEGFSQHESFGNKESEAHVKADNTDRMDELGITSTDDGEKHEAENAMPKYARSLADFLLVQEGQQNNTAVKGTSVAVGADLGEDYSLVKSLIQYFVEALVYCRTFNSKFWGHDLKQFYKDNKAAIDTAIANFTNPGNLMKDVTNLGFSVDALTGVFEESAKKEVDLDTDKKLKKFKAGLKPGAAVALGERAEQNDFLRDKSMLSTMEKAKGGGDRLFIVGDSHRQKLADKIKGLGLDHEKDTDFIKSENTKNIKAAQDNAAAGVLPLDLKKLKVKNEYPGVVRSNENKGEIKVTKIPGMSWRIKDNLGLVEITPDVKYRVVEINYVLELIETATGDKLGEVSNHNNAIQQ